jgi:hypothetical protein
MARAVKRTLPVPMLMLLSSVSLLWTAPVWAVPPALYHSPGDDGVSGGVPATVAAGTGVSLHLYLGVGTTASTADPCFQGDGDELCGHRLRLTGTGLEFQTFSPADPDLVFKVGPDEFLVTGGDFETGELGPTKLGDLVLDAYSTDGTVDLVLGEFVTTQLAKETTTPVTIVQLPEPGALLSLALGAGLLSALNCRRGNRPRPTANPVRSTR